MNDSAIRLSTRMNTDFVDSGVEGSRHWLYFSCRMSRFERLICARMRWKSSSGGSAHDWSAAARLACEAGECNLFRLGRNKGMGWR